MGAQELLEDAAGRASHVAEEVLEGISQDVLHDMPGGTGNSIAWLLWHAARQQDMQIAQLADTEQVWTAQGWDRRFDLGLGSDEIGFGDTAEDVARIRVNDPHLLQQYLDAATAATVGYLRTLSEIELDEIIDSSWDPPVSRGVRIVSAIDDAAQHVGQAAYVRGLVEDSWRAAH